ncbi:MAG: CDP-alcohol phosphatidyltransferase family protein [Candidatus Magasanikbacteria bacterium]
MLDTAQPFAGDKKKGKPFLYKAEKYVQSFVPYVPAYIETYHLTASTVVWSCFIVIFGFLSQYDIQWLWGVSIMILLQWVTDTLDGAVGRTRNTGLIKWGYYMDHFLDYIFMASVFIAYSFIVEDHFKYLLFFVLALYGGFIVNTYLAFSVTNEFTYTYFRIGPTEARLLFIVLNTLLIVFGKTYMGWSLPFVIISALLGLIAVVYQTQKCIWKMDMDKKCKEL